VTILETARLSLVPLSLEMVRARLVENSFAMELGELGVVGFPASWPGDALAVFSLLAERGVDPVPLTFVAVDRATRIVVGQIGAISEVSDEGDQLFGYGFGIGGRGYATEATRAFVRHLRTVESVLTVSAHTATWNVASQRVLEKNGFARVGELTTDEDGSLIVWTIGQPAS
jgi:RimJ/RimL family protein N-acetyltransferase